MATLLPFYNFMACMEFNICSLEFQTLKDANKYSSILDYMTICLILS